MSWTWETSAWKKSTKLLLLMATVWPIVYMVLFMSIVISLVAAAERNRNPCGEIDVLQLDKKIRDGEIKKLSIRSGSIVATDIREGCTYEIFVRSDSSREEILNDARQIVNGRARVEQIEENARDQSDLPPPFAAIAPVGFILIFILHLATILLMMAQMPFYIVLAVKNDHLQQTTRIIWIVLFALVSIFASPVYWYLYIWRKTKDVPIEPAGPISGDLPAPI